MAIKPYIYVQKGLFGLFRDYSALILKCLFITKMYVSLHCGSNVTTQQRYSK